MTVARRGVLATLAALLLLVTGCGAIDAFLTTQEALEAEGFRNASVSWYSTEGHETLYVTWDARATSTETLHLERLSAAHVVWRVAPVHFDEVEADPDTDVTDEATRAEVFSRAELESQFGPRPAGLDRDAGDLLNVRGILIGVGIAAVLGIVLVAVVIVVVVRAMRKRRATAPPPGAWGGWYPPPPSPVGPPPVGPPVGPPVEDPWQAPPG